MSLTLQIPDRELYSTIFQKIDTEVAGKLYSKSIIDEFLTQSMEFMSSDQIEQYFAWVDKDVDDQIDFYQFLQLVYLCQNLKEFDENKSQFLVADTQCVGYIDKWQLSTVFECAGDIDENKIDELMQQYGDSDGKIGCDAFIQLMEDLCG